MSSDGYTYLIKVDSNGNVVLPALNKNAKQADTSLRKIGPGSKQSFGTLNQSAHRSNAALSKTKSLLAGIGLTLTTGALATGIITTGAGFEKSMSNVAALTQAADTELVTLKKSARDAGATTAYSAKQSADAMGYLAQAGYKTNQIIDALPATLSLAAAGSIDLARSADIATNILSQYRMQAKDTGVVVDQMAFTQANFNTNIEEMSDAMNYFGPTAAAFKIGLSESNAVIGLMANNGLKGSLATRALSSSITRLSNPTSKMRDTMDALNLKFFDAEGHFVGMAGMVDTLNNGLRGMTDEQRQAALSTIFGAEAIQEINILLSEGGEKIRHWTEQLDNAGGAAKRMADTKLDNLAGDFMILKSTSQEFALGLYDKISPTLRALTQEATLFIRSMDTKEVGLYAQKFFMGLRRGLIWLKQNKDLIIGLGKGYAVLKVSMLAYNVGARAGMLVTSAYNATLAATKSGAAGASLAVRGLNTALKANPFGMILGAITAVVSAITLFRDRTQEATAAQQELNLEKIQAQFLKQENTKLISDTTVDQERLNLGKANDRQLRRILQDAELRIEKAEDALLLVNVAAKKDKNYQRLQGNLESLDSNTEMDQGTKSFLRSNFLKDINLLKNDISLNVKDLGISYQEARKVIFDNKKLISRIEPLIKDETVTSLGGSGTSAGGSGTASEMSERIVSGGQSQRIVNVSLGKFFEDMVFNVNGASDVIDRREEMLSVFMEGFSRVLNSANQMANG